MDQLNDAAKAKEQDYVKQLKANGTFDFLRKDCLADIESMPTYGSLKKNVEVFVHDFLSSHNWSQSLKKSEVRDNLRRKIYESNTLNNGVNRIIDEAVTPKIETLFKPIIEAFVNDPYTFDYQQFATKSSQRAADSKISALIKSNEANLLKSPSGKLLPIPNESLKKTEVLMPSTSNSADTETSSKEESKEAVENILDPEPVATTPKKTETKVEIEAKVETRPTTTSVASSSAKPATPSGKQEKSENLKKDDKQVTKPSQSANRPTVKHAPIKKTTSQNALRTLISTDQSLRQDPNMEYNFDWLPENFDDVMNLNIEDLSASSVHTSELSGSSTDCDSVASDSNTNESKQRENDSREKKTDAVSTDDKSVMMDAELNKQRFESNRKRTRNLKYFSNDEDSSPNSCASKSKVKRK